MGWLGTVKGAINDVPEDDYVVPIGGKRRSCVPARM